MANLRDEVLRVAEDLRAQAASSEWGTQGAVAAWLGVLADDLENAAKESK